MALVLTRPRRIAGFPKVKRAAQNGMRNLKTIFGLLGKGDRRELIYQFIDTSAADFPISTLCKVCQVSHSGYYRWDNEGRQVYEAACKTRETLKEHVLGRWCEIRIPRGSGPAQVVVFRFRLS